MSYDEEDKLDEEGVFQMDEDTLDELPEGFEEDDLDEDPDNRFH